MIAIVRISGKADMNRPKRDTLKMLQLDAPNHCVLKPNTPDYMGMIEKVRDYVTYGEIDKGTLADLLRSRLLSSNNKKVDESMLKTLGFNSHEEFASSLLEGKVKLKELKAVKPVFRLKPPSNGFKSAKSHYPGGDLGHRGAKINELLKRMI